MGKELDEKVKKAFEKARKKFLFSDVDFHKAIELPEITIISCNGKIGSLIGRNGIIVAELSKELNSKIRVVEHSNNSKKVIADLIGNVRLLGVNEVYEPSGVKIKVIINAHDSKKLSASPEHLEKAIETLTQNKAKLEFR
ncbi:MAG: hypothetical protein ABIH20_01860 [Candidatus Diapherotrites archaeon]